MEKKKQQMLDALEISLGVVSAACEKAGISRFTHYDWLKKDTEYKQAVEAMQEIVFDFAENCLYQQMKNGVPSSTIFFLKTKGKHRGYAETPQVINNNNIGFTPEQLARLSDDELRTLQAIQHKLEGSSSK